MHLYNTISRPCTRLCARCIVRKNMGDRVLLSLLLRLVSYNKMRTLSKEVWQRAVESRGTVSSSTVRWGRFALRGAADSAFLLTLHLLQWITECSKFSSKTQVLLSLFTRSRSLVAQSRACKRWFAAQTTKELTFPPLRTCVGEAPNETSGPGWQRRIMPRKGSLGSTRWLRIIVWLWWTWACAASEWTTLLAGAPTWDGMHWRLKVHPESSADQLASITSRRRLYILVGVLKSK